MKPLHVQVAEALGRGPYSLYETVRINGRWYDVPTWIEATGNETDPPPGTTPGGGPPRYDIDWSATGSLIERLRIDVVSIGPNEWKAGSYYPRPWNGYEGATGPTPLIAVCYLILALKAAGKLDAMPAESVS